MRRICGGCARSCRRSISRSRCSATGPLGARRRALMRGLDRVAPAAGGGAGRRRELPIATAEIEALIAEEERVLAPRRGLRAGAARDDPGAAVAAARASACRGLASRSWMTHWRAERAGRGHGRRARRRMSRCRPSWSGTPTRRSSRRTAPWSSTREEGRSYQAHARARRAAGGDASSPAARSCCSTPLEAVDVPGRLRAARALDRQPRRARAGAPADRGRRQRLRRAARLRARPAVLRGRGEPAARARARRLPAGPRAPAAAAIRRSRWRSAPARARSSSSAWRRCATRFGTVALQRPLGLQPALFLDHLPRADGGTVRDYADILTIEQFAALMPVATHQAGLGARRATSAAPCRAGRGR